MRDVSPRVRALALLPLAALGVHQLRYQLAFGAESDHELAAQGHAYLASLTPVLAFLAALIASELVFRLARAWRGDSEIRSSTRFIALAAVVAATLVAIYAGQELLEGLLASGHPGGLSGVFGEGGWWCLPLALAFGVLIALFLRGADAAVAAVARLKAARIRVTGIPDLAKPRETFVAPLAPFAGAAPTRAPPRIALPR
jgi:hypothetical protein